MIIQVSVVLRRTVWGDLTDIRQPERKSSSESSELWNVSRWYMSLVVNVIGQQSRVVNGHLSVSCQLAVKTVKSGWCISIRLLLVKSLWVYC